MTNDTLYVYGRHTVYEALTEKSHAVKRILLADYVDDTALLHLIRSKGISIETLTNKTWPKDVDVSAVHQGVIASISTERLIVSYSDFVKQLSITERTGLVALGELADTQNVGAIIRSSTAFGIAGILVPEHNQAPITSTVAKVSAGMIFKIPIVTIPSLNNALRDLKDRGFWVYGLDEKGAQSLPTEKFDAPAVFVVGNEGEGLRKATHELCDIHLSIPMNKRCESLNAATSTAIVLYQWSVRKREE
ncbi:MAG: 23S rRNA (guanosine(2251)-2'-O)-methyltransferase RlmB [Candidatus Paceibacterota bacterium]